MKAGEKLFHFLARLILDKFYGSVTIRFECGKVTHVETETRRSWEYKNLPSSECESALQNGGPTGVGSRNS